MCNDLDPAPIEPETVVTAESPLGLYAMKKLDEKLKANKQYQQVIGEHLITKLTLPTLKHDDRIIISRNLTGAIRAFYRSRAIHNAGFFWSSTELELAGVAMNKKLSNKLM